MALNKRYLDPTASGSKGAGAIGIYSSTGETLEALLADGYFDDAYNELAQTKILILEGSDGLLITKVTRSGTTDVALSPVQSYGTASATAGAATLNALSGLITSEALTTAQNAIYTLTLTNSQIAAGDLVFASVRDGTNTQGTPMIGQVNPADNSCVIEVINKHASAEAFNGTVEIAFHVIKVDV